VLKEEISLVAMSNEALHSLCSIVWRNTRSLAKSYS